MAQFPTQALQPGMSGPAVKQLQEYLVSQGYLTQAEMNTGPGSYGPKTKSAVAKLQQAMGVDTAGNPGFWGPRTVSAINTKIEDTKSQIAAKEAELKRAREAQEAQKTGTDDKGTSSTETETKTGTPAKDDISNPNTAKFIESSEFKALSSELQDLVKFGFSSFVGDEAERTNFVDALKQATQYADAFTKAQLGLATSSFELQIAKENNDFVAQKEILERTRKEIASDLKMYGENLSLENQAEMAKALRGYDEDLLNIADQAADKGITFATGARSRALAEERRGTEYQDVVQSGQRTYNLKKKELELRAARGDQEAKDKLAQIESDKGFNLKQIGLKAESILGSTGISGLNLGGYAASGGVQGSLETERKKSIIDILDKTY